MNYANVRKALLIFGVIITCINVGLLVGSIVNGHYANIPFNGMGIRCGLLTIFWNRKW